MSDLGLGPPGFGQGGGKEPALNRGLTGECPTSDLAPSCFWTGGGKEPALNRGLTGECPTSDLAPSCFWTGGDVGTALKKGFTGEFPTPDLAPHLVSDSGGDRQPALNSALTSDLFVWGDVGLCLSYYKSLRPFSVGTNGFGGEG
jgi:hypothetical protein